MIEGLRPEDHVLLLSIPDPAFVRDLAARVPRGIVVVLGERDEIVEARRAAADLDNVMFVPATPDEIPWRDGFFTFVIDLSGGWSDPDRVSREVQRVLAPEGRLYRSDAVSGQSKKS